MLKVFINRKPRNSAWGGGNLVVQACFEYGHEFGLEFTATLSKDLDILFLFDPNYDDLVPISASEICQYKQQYNIPVVHRINECSIRNNNQQTDQLLDWCSRFTDYTIFVSEWVKNYHLNRPTWAGKNSRVLYNGVNKDHFFPRPKTNNGKINIVTHHWSNNPNKGQIIYEFIDNFVGSRSDYTFTYIGRTNSKFKNTKVIEPLFGKALGDELGKYDVYISGTKFDPFPNHIIESIACEIPTYVWHEGGGAVEATGNEHVFNNFNELENIFLSKNYKKNTNFSPGTWKEYVAKFSNILYQIRK